MNRVALLLLASVVLFAAILWSLRDTSSSSRSSGPKTEQLVVYCAASNRAVMEAIRQDYQAEYSVDLEIQYGPSQSLLASLQVNSIGDLYLPADDSYLDLGRQKKLIAEILPLAKMTAVVAVPKGNPKKITAFSDLISEDLRLVQADPESAAIGKLTRSALRKQKLWDPLHAATDAYRTTVTEVANDIKVDAADAAIVFDAVLHEYPDQQAVRLAELEPAQASIAVGVVRTTKQPARALHFARYLAARDRGGLRYSEFGFSPVDGDRWADVPELTLYAGSMLRPAIEETLAAFQDREAARVTCLYNGCGILVANMKAGRNPDAYFACDVEFMNQVQDRFAEPIDVSQNELVILVPEGNPEKIASLRDLTRPGLRVGIGHEKQCAMGWLTQQTLKEGGLQTEVMANVTVQTPTGDMLVNQLRTGSLDAAVAYLTNAAGSGDELDAVRIEGIPCATATQPFAVANDSAHSQLAGRLFEALDTAASKERFLQVGFQWQRDKPTPTAEPTENQATQEAGAAKP